MYDAIQKKTVLVISLIPYRPWVLEVKLNRWKRNQVDRAIQTLKKCFTKQTAQFFDEQRCQD